MLNKGSADLGKTLNVQSFPFHKAFVKRKTVRAACFVDGLCLAESELKALMKT